MLYLLPCLLNNTWLQYLEQVGLGDQKYLKASEHPAHSLACIKNTKLPSVHAQHILSSAPSPGEFSCFQGMCFWLLGLSKEQCPYTDTKSFCVKQTVCLLCYSCLGVKSVHVFLSLLSHFSVRTYLGCFFCTLKADKFQDRINHFPC